MCGYKIEDLANGKFSIDKYKYIKFQCKVYYYNIKTYCVISQNWFKRKCDLKPVREAHKIHSSKHTPVNELYYNV